MALINSQPVLDALKATSNYRYPDSLGTPPFEKWILFQVKNATHINRSGGTTAGADVDDTKASVALYLPPEALNSSLSASYDSSGYGILGGALLDKAVQTGQEVQKIIDGQQSFGRGLINILTEKLGPVGTGIGIDAVQEAAEKIGISEQTQANVIGTFANKVTNPRVDLFYRSTDYRTHDLQFTLIPRNKAEAETIDNILNLFQEAMLADYGGNFQEEATPNFIGYPYEFDIKMFTQVGASKHHINTIDRSVLTSMSVNHASGTRVAFVDSRGDAEYYPASTTLRLTFKETRIQGRNNIFGWKRGGNPLPISGLTQPPTDG